VCGVGGGDGKREGRRVVVVVEVVCDWERFDAGFESVMGAGLGLHVKVVLLRESILQSSALE
jgi:hypothetical protein